MAVATVMIEASSDAAERRPRRRQPPVSASLVSARESLTSRPEPRSATRLSAQIGMDFGDLTVIDLANTTRGADSEPRQIEPEHIRISRVIGLEG